MNNVCMLIYERARAPRHFLLKKKGTLWVNCKFLLKHFKGTKAIAFIASMKYQAWNLETWFILWIFCIALLLCSLCWGGCQMGSANCKVSGNLYILQSYKVILTLVSYSLKTAPTLLGCWQRKVWFTN